MARIGEKQMKNYELIKLISENKIKKGTRFLLKDQFGIDDYLQAVFEYEEEYPVIKVIESEQMEPYECKSSIILGYDFEII